MASMEKMISYCSLVPMGNGCDLSGPEVPNCIWGLPICFWGPPGVAKSARVRSSGLAIGMSTEVTLPSQRAPEDFSGVPTMRPNGELTIECILGAVRNLMALTPHPEWGPRGIWFIDEATGARPATQGALLGAVQDRRVGDTALPPGIRIFLAANPPKDAAGGWALTAPLANRMGHVDVETPSREEWSSWLMGRKPTDTVNLSYGEELVRVAWNDAWARARGMMAGFMHRATDETLYCLPKEGNVARGRAWPSPRTWEWATRCIATCLALDPHTGLTQETGKKSKDGTTQVNIVANQMAFDMVAACVGLPAATEWAEWIAKADLPDPEDVLDNGWSIDKLRLDRNVAVLETLTAFVLSRPTAPERVHSARKYWKFIMQMIQAGFAELAYAASLALCQHEEHLDSTHPQLAATVAQVQLALGNGIARHI